MFLCISLSEEKEKRKLLPRRVSIRQHPSKSLDGKYQDHLALDGASSCVLDRKTNPTWRLFALLIKKFKKPLTSRVSNTLPVPDIVQTVV